MVLQWDLDRWIDPATKIFYHHNLTKPLNARKLIEIDFDSIPLHEVLLLEEDEELYLYIKLHLVCQWCSHNDYVNSEKAKELILQFKEKLDLLNPSKKKPKMRHYGKLAKHSV